MESYGFVESGTGGVATIKCYNYGDVESFQATGGIVGGAWDPEKTTITIRGCYNTGKIKCDSISNGGILGETEEDNTITNIKVMGCYNIGEIESSFPNQISNKYANITYSYYLVGRENISEYGIAKEEEQFKTIGADTVSKEIVRVTAGYWTISEINNGYLSLVWQNE